MEREEAAAALRKLTFESGSHTFPVYALFLSVMSPPCISQPRDARMEAATGRIVDEHVCPRLRDERK